MNRRTLLKRMAVALAAPFSCFLPHATAAASPSEITIGGAAFTIGGVPFFENDRWPGPTKMQIDEMVKATKGKFDLSRWRE